MSDILHRFPRLALNFAVLSGGEFVSKLFGLAAFAYLARVLGPKNFGSLEFTLAVMVFFNLFVDGGSGQYGAREIAKDNDRVRSISKSIIILRIALAAIGYLFLIAFVLLLPLKEALVQRLILIYGLTLFGVPGFLQWVFQGLDRMKYVALGSIIRQSIFVIGVFLLVRRTDQLWVVALVECMAVGGLVLYNLYIFRSQIDRFPHLTSTGLMRSSFFQAFPIGLSELLWAFSWYSATVLLGLLAEPKAVGYFGAAHRSIMALHTFVWLYFYNLLPSISRCTEQPRETLQNLMRKSIRATSWFAFFLGTVGTILAQPMLRVVYGSEYIQAAPTFRLLIWVLAVMLLSGHYTYTLIAFNNQRLLLICYASSAVLTVSLGAFLIPRYEAFGAATAILASAILNWIMAYAFVRQKVVRIPFGIQLRGPMAAGAIAICGFLIASPFSLPLSCVVATILYICVLSIFEPNVVLNIRMLAARNR